MIFSSDDFHPRDRFAAWHDVACKTIVKHDSRPDDASHFYARLKATALNDIALMELENAAMSVERTKVHAENADHDDYLLCIQRCGQIAFQGAQDTVLSAGQATVLDPAETYVGQFGEASRMLVARLPRRELEARMGSAKSLILNKLDWTSPDLFAASSLLTSIMDAKEGPSEAGAFVIRDAILDLVAIALGRTLEGKVRISNAKEQALRDLRLAVNSNLSDPEFSVDAAAQAAGISVRYANALLNTEHTSLYRLIITQRLQKCAVALRDPNQRNRSIQDIAYGWGFSDQSYFGRRFKEAYGCSPRDYRMTHDQLPE